jgi:two-component system nitrogen regulation response regulator NtrX
VTPVAAERVLIVDDEKNIVTSLEGILSDEGYQVSSAADGLGALEKIQQDPPDLILLDIWLPGMDGIEVLKTVKNFHPEIEVLVMSGHGTIDTAVKATKLGACDFIEKPFSLDQLIQSIENVFKEKRNRTPATSEKHNSPQNLPLCFELMVEVKKTTLQAADNNHPVLILGEKGTGKEFLATAIHNLGKKADRPFIKLDCAVKPVREIQSHLFASTRGSETEKNASAKTGKKSEKVIYLSNVDSLSKSLQEKLVTILTGGDSKGSKTSARFLPARLYISSSKDLESLADNNKFNKNLLQIFENQTLNIPPLRQLAANIPLMIRDYFDELSTHEGQSPTHIDEDAMAALCQYQWLGNVKELRSVIERAKALGKQKGRISLQDLPAKIHEPQSSFKIADSEESDSHKGAEVTLEKGFLIHHLRKNDWDLSKTSKALNTTKKEISKKLRLHSIKLPAGDGNPLGKFQHLQRTLKRSVVLCGSGLHSGIKTGLILQPLPPGSGIIFGDITSGDTIPARLDNVTSTDYSTCIKEGMASVGTIEHIMAVLHMYRITNLLIKIGDEAPVMDGSARDFCALIEDGEFDEQDGVYDEIVIDKTYYFGEEGKAYITVEPCDTFKVTYHIDYPQPIGVEEHTFTFSGENHFKKEIAPARTFGFMEDVAQLTKMGFASGGKLDNFILLGDGKVLNTKLRYKNEFSRHKILDILGDFYLLGRPIRGHIKAHKSGHTENIGMLKVIQENLAHM